VRHPPYDWDIVVFVWKRSEPNQISLEYLFSCANILSYCYRTLTSAIGSDVVVVQFKAVNRCMIRFT